MYVYNFFLLGPLLKDILEHLNAFNNNNNQDTRRAYFYSAHDITLVNLLRTMGFTDEYFKPEYGSTLIFQLHATSNFTTEDMELKVILLLYRKQSFFPNYVYYSFEIFLSLPFSQYLYFQFLFHFFYS